MGRSENDWRHRLSLLLRDPWFWVLVVVGALVLAVLDQWLPETWADWVRPGILFLGITIFWAFRGERYRH
jgi:hypothetical protein